MSDPHPEHTETLIGPYLFGELSEQDAAHVRAYLEEHPEWREIVAGVKLALQPDGPPPPAASDAVQRLMDRMDQSERRTPAASTRKERDGNHNALRARRPFHHASGLHGGRWIALGVAVATTLGALLVMGKPVKTETKTERVYATARGQYRSLTLEDGTVLRLAPQTTVTIPNGFGHTTRTLALRGEAQFTVTTASSTPFIVHTGTISTRVLGTTFDVRQYAPNQAVEVAVHSGRVVTAGHGTPVTISAGEVASITDSSATVRSRRDPGVYTDWQRGALVFREMPVPTILASLARWFGYDFRLMDSTIAAKRLTAEFRVGDAAEMFRILQIGLGVTLSRDGNVVTLTSDPSNRPDQRIRTRLEYPLQPSMEMGK